MENLDSKEGLERHRKIIRTKKVLNLVYRNFYFLIKQELETPDKVVEIGSGAGFAKEVIPNLETSDLVKAQDVDKVFSADSLPYKGNSIGSFVMLNVLHHIKKREKAFREMYRCLKPGGKIVMIEPYNSIFGGFVYRFLHYEYFNPSSGWKVPGRRMSDSNTALPWIIFVRDRSKFEKLFPKLKIIKVEPHTPFSYLASGGLTKPQLIPTFLFSLLRRFEKVLSRLNPLIGMFVTIVLEKTD